ncbi:hypothetical protein WJX74_008129 [Apatococcus lobatus]|uniref:Uncharacterized protein n=1 Tax=Apatococcus lobatus TaxID=904363 RepID=A0AAW1QNB6_9CHLO
MVELRHEAEGLNWIISQEPLQLLLIPGLQSASITAAAAGNHQALSYLRFVAQYSAAHRSMLNPSEMDMCCLRAAELHPEDSDDEFVLEEGLLEISKEIRDAFLSRQDTFTAELLRQAVEEGQLAALQWIMALCHRIYGDDEELMQLAASRGRLEVMQFLRSGPRPAPWNEEVTQAAVQHPLCLQWLLTQPEPCPHHQGIVEKAARCGSLEALKVLHAAKLLITVVETSVCRNAAAHPSSSIPMLQWLRAQAPPVRWSESTCRVAASTGNLALLQWLRAQNPPCPWGITCAFAAANTNNLGLLKWLLAQSPPCPWSHSCEVAATRAGNVAMLQWLRAQNPARAPGRQDL